MTEANGSGEKTNSEPPATQDSSASVNSDVEATLGSSAVIGITATERTGIKSIGPYRLLKKLGEGGMGQVWLAEQTAPMRRQVALKLIKVGMYDDSVLRRFESERQSLAIMDHPSIAKVFDAGAAPDGQPYFVMEYVPGLPITDYCDQKRLKIRERLELFIKVCEGVQHAHQKAIIHRDLKPANILVVQVDGKPMPRIIDFGLAKATGPQIAGERMFTQTGGWVGTPGYMSPEQADTSVSDIDTRTDVYSLGAVLYVLLTGSLPFDSKQWRKLPFYDVLRQLREDDPPRPSTKLSMTRESSVGAAEARGVQPKQLVRLLRGDLDWITVKAIEKARSRRYGTPSELATDVTRYLYHEPVAARPASASYRLQRYVRRHRLGVAVAAGLVLLLGSGAVMQAVQVRRITRERDRASRVTEFMTNMFKVSGPSEARGNTITAREILDKASKDVETGLAKDPETQAQMMHVMGIVYEDLGLYRNAESLLTRAVGIRRSAIGSNSRDTLESMGRLAWVLNQEGRRSESETLCRQTLEAQRRLLGSDDPDSLRSTSDLAVILANKGQYSEAEKLFRETLDARRRILGPRHRDTLVAMSNLAVTLYEEGRSSEAETLDRETLEIRRRVLGPDHPETLASIQNLAAVLGDERKYRDAENLERNAIDILRRVLGPEHMQTLMAVNNLAEVLQKEARYNEAETLQRETLSIQRRVLGPDHPETLRSMTALSYSLAHMGHFEEAETLQQETIKTQRRVFGPEHPETASSTFLLGRISALRGRHNEAFSLLNEAVDHGLPPDDDLGIETDDDFKSLQGDPRFAALVAHAKQVAHSKTAAPTQKTN